VEEMLNQDWRQKKLKDSAREDHDMRMYVNFGFKKDFKMNEFQLEPFKAPKILGDVFEAIIGAIFRDSGIETVINVLKPILAPFVLYVAKFSKSIHKEPKEDFI
jgi:dsRNA-specific ribonuclease